MNKLLNDIALSRTAWLQLDNIIGHIPLPFEASKEDDT